MKMRFMKKTNYIDPYLDIYERDLHRSLEYLMDKRLTERERTCIREFYFNSKTYIEISKKYKVSTERIRQITLKGLRKLRRPPNDSLDTLYQEIVETNYPDRFYSEDYISKLRTIEPIYPFTVEEISPSKFLKINEVDTPKMKFKKFLLNYPHLKKYNWRSDFSDKHIEIDFSVNYINNVCPFLVFIPTEPNLLYQVTDLKKHQDVIYKWTLFNS